MRIYPILFVTLFMFIVTNKSFSKPVIKPSQSAAYLSSIVHSPAISVAVTKAVNDACIRFKNTGLTRDGIAVALIIDENKVEIGGYNLNQVFYPASLVKLGWAVAYELAEAQGKLQRTEETERAFRDMLKESSNSAAGIVVDALTGITSGDMTGESVLEEFISRRKELTKTIRSFGLGKTKASQKTWDNEPYGLDAEFLTRQPDWRNAITARDAACLMWLVMTDRIISPEACTRIQRNIRRVPGNTADFQANRIGGSGIKGISIWSKAGWTDEVNHDVAYIDLSPTKKVTLAILTNTSEKHGNILSWIAKRIIDDIRFNRIEPEQPRLRPFRRPGAPR